jgi:hypothetical protein
MILSTMPGMTVLGFCKTLAESDSSSAILTDFDMRASAISFLILASIALPVFFLRFLMDSFPTYLAPHSFLMIQTIKQMINRVPSSPYPNIVSPSSIQPLLFKG